MDTDTTGLGAGHVPAATAEILDGLNDLLQLDHDAVGAYEIAMKRLTDRDHAAQISGFLRDHERHIRELNELIMELGGTPKNQPHATGVFKLALQGLGALAGDRGVLRAFRQNELQVRAKYDTYAARANHWPSNVKRTIDRAALDEERHYRWVSDVMKAAGWGHGEGPELDGIDAAREHLMVHGSKVDQAREMVADAAGVARERASELADVVAARAGAVRNRIQDMVGGQQGGNVYAGAALGDGDYRAPSHDPMSQLRDRAHTVAAGARDAGDTFDVRYQERPLQTLLIAGVAGFVLGRLLR